MSGRISTGALAPAATGAASNASQKMGTWPVRGRVPVRLRGWRRGPGVGSAVRAGAAVLDMGPPEMKRKRRSGLGE
ncbi:hypothetical protein GCM10010252_03960 [Streptomyces aureoverticillatus]|nr:hypothetical protein GCM10010252_03960 [Streptomyces aureoverticillatus]